MRAMRVSSETASVKRTLYPTVDPSGTCSSSLTRSAIVRAAMRRGWVWAIEVRPSSRQIFGSCVVLPDPVAPATITTWWSRMAAAISSRAALTGSSDGYEMTGSGADIALHRTT